MVFHNKFSSGMIFVFYFNDKEGWVKKKKALRLLTSGVQNPLCPE
jgi:hypothetical protein